MTVATEPDTTRLAGLLARLDPLEPDRHADLLVRPDGVSDEAWANQVDVVTACVSLLVTHVEGCDSPDPAERDRSVRAGEAIRSILAEAEAS